MTIPMSSPSFIGDQMTRHYTRSELMGLSFNGNMSQNLKIKNGNVGNGLSLMVSILQAFMRKVPNRF